MVSTIKWCVVTVLLGATSVAMAHSDAGSLSGGFASGFTHPLLGPDHVIAMVAVGLWGAFLGKPSIWLLPIVFPLIMAFGGALGVAGVPVPAVETGIALSGLVLGLMVAFAVRAPLWLATILVGVFAIFHGHAHGTELPEATSPMAYSVGFVIATGMLHLFGIVFGELRRWDWGGRVVRAGGSVIALAGLGFLVGFL